MVSKQIPWIVQAQMARDGYTTMEDLACRWTTADLARTQSPTDLKFKDGENGFDQQGSNFTAMRIYHVPVWPHVRSHGHGTRGESAIQLGCLV